MISITVVEFFEVVGSDINGKNTSLGIVIRNSIDAEFNFIENIGGESVLPGHKVIRGMSSDLLCI